MNWRYQQVSKGKKARMFQELSRALRLRIHCEEALENETSTEAALGNQDPVGLPEDGCEKGNEDRGLIKGLYKGNCFTCHPPFSHGGIIRQLAFTSSKNS